MKSNQKSRMALFLRFQFRNHLLLTPFSRSIQTPRIFPQTQLIRQYSNQISKFQKLLFYSSPRKQWTFSSVINSFSRTFEIEQNFAPLKQFRNFSNEALKTTPSPSSSETHITPSTEFGIVIITDQCVEVNLLIIFGFIFKLLFSKMLNKIVKQDWVKNKAEAKLRVFVKGGGCSGLEYEFQLTEDPLAEDDV